MAENIILVGFMGCGKTTVGLALAKAKQCAFIDTDEYIEKKLKSSISDIFKQKGEKFFREQETECLAEIIKKQDAMVLSVGGGTPVYNRNRELLKKAGRVVYLKTSPEVLYERLKNDVTRPLLQVPDPQREIIRLLSEREKYYQSLADYTILSDRQKVDDLVSDIIQKSEGGKNVEYTGNKRTQY